MGIGHDDPWVESHMWPQHMGVKGHLGVNDLWFKFFSKKCHCINTLWCIFMGLGHTDPRVESHVRPQQMWGQRSSRGQLPLVQVFAKRSLYPHTLMYFHARLVVREPPCCASCGKMNTMKTYKNWKFWHAWKSHCQSCVTRKSNRLFQFECSHGNIQGWTKSFLPR